MDILSFHISPIRKRIPNNQAHEIKLDFGAGKSSVESLNVVWNPMFILLVHTNLCHLIAFVKKLV